MKVFNLIFCVLFILFAGLQYNDPDPYLWIPIYGYAAYMCWLVYRGRPNRAGLIAGTAFCLVYAAYLFVADDGVLSWIRDHNAENIAGSMKAETPWIEDSREFFGLLIIVVVFVVDLLKTSKKHSA